MKCSVEVAAGVFARFSCRHSWNLRLRLTEPDNHRPANTIDVLRPKLSMLSWHSSNATSVTATLQTNTKWYELYCLIGGLLQKIQSGTQNWSLPIARMHGNS